MSFFYICDSEIANDYNKAIPLKIVRDNGIQVTPNIDISVTDLISTNKNTVFKNFYNRGYGGITFTIQVIFDKNDTSSKSFTETKYYPTSSNTLNWIDYWVKNMVPLYVVTDAIDIKNGLYIITDNSSRVQTFKNYTVWELEFTTFTGLNSITFSNTTKALKSVINKYKKSKAKKKATTSKSKTTKKSKLSKCKISQIKYTGKKKSNIKCVKYMQEILYKEGFLTKKQIDGWFGPKTKNALKKYQKKHKLKQTGTVNTATFKKLCK